MRNLLGRLPDLQISKHGHTKQSEVITIVGGMSISRERSSELAQWCRTKSVWSTKNQVVMPIQLVKLGIATGFWPSWEQAPSLRKGEKVSFMDAWQWNYSGQTTDRIGALGKHWMNAVVSVQSLEIYGNLWKFMRHWIRFDPFFTLEWVLLMLLRPVFWRRCGTAVEAVWRCQGPRLTGLTAEVKCKCIQCVCQHTRRY